MKSIIRKSTLLILIAFFAIMSAKSQSIQGKVYDENGITIPGAVVLLEGYNRNQLTDEDGSFLFRKLRPHKYTVIAQIVGYKPKSVEVDLSDEADHKIEIKLESNVELREVEVFGERYKQPEKLDAITRMPLRPSEQIQSISVISEVVIAEQGALTVANVIQNVPGVTLFGSYGGVKESFTSRGFRGIPVLKNGVRTDSQFQTASILTDMQGVESVQMIKGSAAITQGVITDIGNAGGVINVVTKTPKFTNAGEVGFRVGSWGQVRPTFDVQSVLDKNRTIAFRINGAYERNDNYRPIVNSDKVYINPSLEWRPDDKTTVTLEMDYMNDNRVPVNSAINLANMDVEALYEIPRNKFLGTRADNINTKTMTYAARITRYLTDNISVRAAYFKSSYKFDNLNTSIGSKAINNDWGTRARSLGRSYRDDDNSTFQLDLIGRDIYTGPIKHTFQVGFDYRVADATSRSYNSLSLGNIDILNGEWSTEAPSIEDIKKFVTLKAESRSKYSTYGIMAQEVMTINKYLKAILGIRYSSISVENEEGGRTLNDAWNPMAGIMITPIKNINIFGSYTTSTSLRNAADILEDKISKAGAATTSQWEVGFKSEWLNERLRFNFTYFNILTDNLTNTKYEINDEGIFEETIYKYKAGNIRRDGIEVELNGRILDNLQVMIGYAYLNARYKDSPSYVNGSAPMNAAKHTANAWVQYKVDKSFLKGLSLGLGAYYVGKRPVNEYSTKYDGHGTPVNTKPFDMPSYITVNAQLGYTYGKVTARVFFNNIFDEIGYNSYYRGGYINQIDPRNFAGVVTYSF
ncbi:TonB-dependent receptor [Dysgonomonas massiliensis]|uniref:TonB-dependent receptor n=1 Tax=Dysgonomonas massiliensis TaxID=2040292 RepID=UPI000C76C58A|nr:TonB-dependent receptor [Dysgonomonas massiliensis]